MTLLSLSHSSSPTLCSNGPIFICGKKLCLRLKFPSEKIGCGTSDASDTSDASNTANSSDASKTSASVTRLSSYCVTQLKIFMILLLMMQMWPMKKMMI